MAGLTLPAVHRVSGWSMLRRQTAIVSDVMADTRVPAELYAATLVRSLVMVPIGRPEPAAAVGAYWAGRGQPTHGDLIPITAAGAYSGKPRSRFWAYELGGNQVTTSEGADYNSVDDWWAAEGAPS